MTESVMNKTMDRLDLYTPQVAAIITELNSLIRTLQAQGLAASSWYGTLDLPHQPVSVERAGRGIGYEPLEGAADDRLFPWFLYWEIAWVAGHSDFRPGQRVLDLGGASSLFSFYLAHKGCRVVTVDLQANLVENANRVARRMGWDMENMKSDMRVLSFSDVFDHVTSICVFEHLPIKDRMRVVSRVRDWLRPGGRFSITFDYRNPARSMQIGSVEDVERQFVLPSNLRVRDNRIFADNRQNYLLHPFYFHKPYSLLRFKIHSVLRGDFPAHDFFRPKHENDYTFGALFLEKAEG